MFNDTSGRVKLEITELEFDVLKNLVERRLSDHELGAYLLGDALMTLVTSLRDKLSDNNKDISWSYVE